MRSEHLKPLTSLRFFAAAAIVIFHMKMIVPLEIPGVLSQGVSFFFVLSGFILTHVYGTEFSLRSFYVNRFARLWPVHLATFCLAVVALGLWPRLAQPVWQLIAVANLTMTHAWFPFVGLPFSFNGPSWSISSELFFYLCFPLLMAVRRFWFVYAGIAALTFVCLLGADLFSQHTRSPVFLSFHKVHFVLQHPLVRLLEFATGIAAARLFAASPPPSMTRWHWTMVEISAIGLLASYWLTSHWVRTAFSGQEAFGFWYHESGGFLLFAWAITVFACGKGIVGQTLSNRWLIYLGEISYCTYMLHQIVIRFLRDNELFGLDWPVAAGLAVLITYAGSVVLFHSVEKPARRRILAIASPRVSAHIPQVIQNTPSRSISPSAPVSKVREIE